MTKNRVIHHALTIIKIIHSQIKRHKHRQSTPDSEHKLRKHQIHSQNKYNE